MRVKENFLENNIHIKNLIVSFVLMSDKP